MTYTIVQKPLLLVIGIECQTSNDPGCASKDIPQLWEKFNKENITQNIPNKVSNAIIGLYSNYEGDRTKPYSYLIGCQVHSIANLPPGMVAKTIPEATYAVFTTKNTPSNSLIGTWETIWKTNLKRAYTYDFEIHPENHSKLSTSPINIFIAINNYFIDFQIDPSPIYQSILFNGINANALKVKAQKPVLSFGFFIKDSSGTPIAGITSIIYYGCLHIDMLWVNETYRKHGLGSLLIQKCEKFAKDKSCTFATVDTMDWEALPFYQKLGFIIEFVQEGFVNNSIKYLLRKPL
ncbi:MAG: GNAT family N-acetyltransferase [Chlamydiales bacterium]|nr:GNAT family N-acetyltransferase [Chlamydiales bacterium]